MLRTLFRVMSSILVGFIVFAVTAFVGLGSSGLLNFGPNAAAALGPSNYTMARISIIVAAILGVVASGLVYGIGIALAYKSK